jgi:hypothetical protein
MDHRRHRTRNAMASPEPKSPLLSAKATTGVAILAELAALAMFSWRLADFAGAVHQPARAAAIVAGAIRLLLSSPSLLAMRKARSAGAAVG